MANTSAIWQQAAHTTYQPSSPSCSTRAIQKSSSSGSNWILMSRQPHRVTSGKSNSGHKQIHISKLFSHIYIYQPFVKSIYKTNWQSFHKHKTYIHKHQTIFFEELVPSILPLLKEHIRLRTCWYRRPFHLKKKKNFFLKESTNTI